MSLSLQMADKIKSNCDLMFSFTAGNVNFVALKSQLDLWNLPFLSDSHLHFFLVARRIKCSYF